MSLRIVCCLLLTLALPSAFSQHPEEQPKNPTDWLERAYDATNLRIPGATPFHIKVSFHAYPGLEFRDDREKNEIVTGDGAYEETWISVDQWRREVSLNDYHAVEVKSPATSRKMQASADYEPSRILMLLNALYYPIPRNFVSSEFRRRSRSGWKLDYIDFNGQSLVRISKSIGSQSAEYTDSFVFQPQGLLNMRNDEGMTTVWSDYAPFGDKLVPKELTILAGDRKLLTARISIDAPGQGSQDEFDLPSAQAEPGTTLRPLQSYEVRLPDLSDSWFGPAGSSPLAKPAMLVHGVIDKQGRNRELEVIYGPSTAQAKQILDHFRSIHHKAPTIDGSPCESVMRWIWM